MGRVESYIPQDRMANAKEFTEVDPAGLSSELDGITAGKCTKCVTAPCRPPAPKCSVPCTGKCRRV